MNFDNCELLKSEIGEYITTDILEPDPIKRHEKYPFVDEVQIEIYHYKSSDGKIFKKTITNCKSSAKNVRLKERYNSFKANPFGQSCINNLEPSFDNIIGVEYSKKKTKTVQSSKNLSFTPNNRYVPSKLSDNNVKKQKENDFKKSEYIPSSISKQIEEESKLPQFRLILKNLPTYYSLKDMDYILRDKLSKFGTIKKLKLIKNTNSGENLIKDICFLEFQSMKQTIQFYESKQRIVIDNSILLVEKVK